MFTAAGLFPYLVKYPTARLFRLTGLEPCFKGYNNLAGVTRPRGFLKPKQTGEKRAEVDFAVVKKNASEQGVSLESISIYYEGLSWEELKTMKKLSLVMHEAGKVVIAKFPSD